MPSIAMCQAKPTQPGATQRGAFAFPISGPAAVDSEVAGLGVRRHRLEGAIPAAHPARRLRHQPERPREETMNRTGHITGSIIVAATLFAATSAIAQTP